MEIMSTKEFMNLSDSEIKNRYLDNGCGSFNITNFYYMGKIYIPGKCRGTKLKKPYPTLEVEAEPDRATVIITYKTKKIKLVVRKNSCTRIDREGYDFRYTTDRDS